MVFRIKADLTREDRDAWRQLAADRGQMLRRERRAAVWQWAKDKLAVLPGMAFGVWGLYAAALGRGSLRDQIYVRLCSLLLLLAGILSFAVYPYPDKRQDRLPGKDFPPSGMPDMLIRAAFFGDGCFTFWEYGAKIRLSYGAVTGVWEDKGRFYLFFEDRPPLVLPKRGLGAWMLEDFREFLERELEAAVERM